jgi:hypothetical protein
MEFGIQQQKFGRMRIMIRWGNLSSNRIPLYFLRLGIATIILMKVAA